MFCKYKRGFSLLELSIALIIIGLVVGGVFKGTALIRATELKAIVAQVDEYKAAIGQFEFHYEGLPGDISNATDYWAASANGDASSTIDAETSDEPFRAIKQLTLAGLMKGNFSGIWDTGFVFATTGTSGNTMESKINATMLYAKCCSSTDYARAISYNNHINFAAIYASDNDYRAGALTPTEAFNIDKKIDDGIPDYGFVGGSGSYNGAAYAATGCYTGTGGTSLYESSNATYKDANNCQMQFAYDWD